MHPQHKKLMILRHAKAAWPGGVTDFDRPLAERGHLQAPQIGRWLLEHDAVPDYILSSSALRTRQTTTWVAQELGEVAPTPKLDARLYESSAAQLIALINNVPERVTRLLVVAHMPAVQDALIRLASAASDEEAVIDLASHYPPGGLAVMNVEQPWALVDGRDAQVTDFFVPQG